MLWTKNKHPKQRTWINIRNSETQNGQRSKHNDHNQNDDHNQQQQHTKKPMNRCLKRHAKMFHRFCWTFLIYLWYPKFHKCLGSKILLKTSQRSKAKPPGIQLASGLCGHHNHGRLRGWRSGRSLPVDGVCFCQLLSRHNLADMISIYFLWFKAFEGLSRFFQDVKPAHLRHSLVPFWL